MSNKKSKNLRVSVHGGEAAGANAPHFHPHQYMLNGSKHELINAKSQYDAEFRRFAIDTSVLNSEDKFRSLLTRLHNLKENDFYITYIDKSDGDFLPINNDDNYAQALRSYAPPSVLRIIIKRKDQDGGATISQTNRYGDHQSSTLRTPFKSLLSREQNNSNGSSSSNVRRRNNQQQIQIGQPQNFRPVSSIIDADILPDTLRRVKMMKHNNERPLGFYIRDGVCVRPTSNGIEKVPGIYISRVVQGGLAESTGLLNVDDEVLEVNGIDVEGKTLDQVTDMMIANSSNLILTIKPANQGHVSWSGGAAAGGTMGDRSSSSKLSHGSTHSATSSSRSSGASGSLPRRGVKNIESTTSKTSKLPSSLLATARNGQQQQQQTAAAVGNSNSSSWRDAKFRTSQTSQVSSASASSSSMSIGGAAGGGSNHSPYDVDDMDEIREYPVSTAAAYEMLQRQQLQQQQQCTDVAGNAVYSNDSLPNVLQRRDQQRRRDSNPQSAGVSDAGLVNPAFSSDLQSIHADAPAANGGSNGTRTNRVTNGTARSSAGYNQHTTEHAPPSSRSSGMDMF